METLFELPDKVELKKESKYRCRTCANMITHQYNSSFKYCKIQQSKLTSNGFKKIKANDFGCKNHTRN